MPFALIADVEGLMQALGRHGNDDIGIVYDVANKEISFKRPSMLKIIAPDAEKGHPSERRDKLAAIGYGRA